MANSNENLVENPQVQSLSVFQSFGVGAVIGGAGAFIDQPLFSLKIQLQKQNQSTIKTPLNFSLPVLFRGIETNAGSMVPITALQLGFNHIFKNFYYQDVKELSTQQKFFSSFVAGVGSAFVTCPAELVIIHQSATGLSFVKQAKQLANAGGLGIFYKGLMTTMLREGIFSSCLQTAAPFFKSVFMPYLGNELISSVTGSIAAGVKSTLLSQSIDNIKTDQQSAAMQQAKSILQSAKSIYSSKGLLGFLQGLSQDAVRL